MNVGVTSGGDFFGGTQVTFTDVLGDKQFNFFAASVSQYRTMSFSYMNLSRRLQYALQGFSQTQFYYGYRPGRCSTATSTRFLDRDDALATQTLARRARRSASIRSTATRALELSGGLLQLQAGVQRPGPAGRRRTSTRRSSYGRTLFSSGNFMPLGVDVRPGDDGLPRVRAARRQHGARSATNTRRRSATCCRRQTVDVDARYYMRLGDQRRARVPRPRLQELGRVPGLHVLRRQLRAARLRLPRVPRQQGVLRQRRAALPADRSGADAARRHRRPARRRSSPTSAPPATKACR